MNPDRKLFLGGSDAAAVFGVSPWSTPLDIYFSKTSDEPEVVDSAKAKIFKRGKRLEPIVLEMAREEWELDVVKVSTQSKPNRYVDPKFDFLAAEIDFEWMDEEGNIQNGEIKTVHPFAADKFGEYDTEEVPIEYAAQAMHGLMITGRQRCLFAVLVGADNLLRYTVERDEETIAAMREKELAFWNLHVIPRIPPPPVNLDDSLRLFRRDIASQMLATAELVEMAKALKKARDDTAFAEAAADDLKYRITVAMLGLEAMQKNDKPGKHVLLDGGRELLTVAFQEQKRIDTEALRLRYPKIANECSKTTKFHTVKISRKKS